MRLGLARKDWCNVNGLNPDSVMTGVYDGAAYWGDMATSEPVTGLAASLDSLGFVNLGYISEDGPTLNLPGEADATAVRAWQRAAIIRTIRTPNEEQPTWEFTLIQQDAKVIELSFGVNVTQLAPNEIRYVIDGNTQRPHGRLVLDVISGSQVARYYSPNAVVTAIGALTFSNDGTPMGYPITISSDFSTEINGQIEVWQRTVADFGEPAGWAAGVARGGVGDVAPVGDVVREYRDEAAIDEAAVDLEAAVEALEGAADKVTGRKRR